jgi:hypothetical protein
VLLQGFFREFFPVCGAFVSTGIGDVSAGFGHARMTGTSCVRCTPGGVAVRRAKSLGPFEAIGVSSPSCFKRALATPSQGGGCGFHNPHRLGRGLQIPR